MVFFKSKYNIIRSLALTLPIMLLIGTTACSDESLGNRADKDMTIDFTYWVKEASRVATRTLDSVYITQTYDIPIYIELETTNEDTGQPINLFGTYEVQSGYEGRLASISGADALNWQNLTENHTFYGWTVPWNPDYQPSRQEIEFQFENSSNLEGYNENKNNSVLEKLIGAKSDSYSYDNHGKYVDLTFFHLVSKIKIGTFQLTESSGAIQKNLKADITFIGLPTNAVLSPHPQTGGPVVTYDPQSIDYDTGITYYIDNDAVGSDVFYICPEVDFSNLTFQVELKDEAYAAYNIYYGNFDAVKFERTAGNDYDLGDGTDEKVLHAGEMMTLNINLIPGVGPGLALIIDKWNTEEPNESQYHTHQGVYSDADMNQILNAFLNQGNPNNPTTDSDIERLFDIYGQEENDEKVFPIYDNVTVSDAATVPVPKGYILDGQGHTLILNKPHHGVFPGNPPYVNIGLCRDLYITDGTNFIYVDKEGNIWKMDPQTQVYSQTEYSLEPLEGNYKSYDIDLTTGQVKQSTYYNNFIDK